MLRSLCAQFARRVGDSNVASGIHGTALSVILVLLAGVAPVAAAQPNVTIAWNASSGAAGYVLFYGLAPGSYTTAIDVGNKTTATFAPPVGNQAYYFVVKAYNSSGQQSGPSNEAAAW